MFRSFIACITLAAALGAARADDCPVKSTLETYYAPKTLPKGPDSRCDMKDGKCSKLELRGYLYRPTTAAGKAPVLVFNHGSEQYPGSECDIGSYFSQLGYFVFAPHRRGHGKSTGAYLDEYIKTYCSKKGDGNFCKMEDLHKQVDDVAEAIAYLKTIPGVDASRIALMGHSFGGITTAFANAKDLGQRAVVVGAGASQSWEGNPDARTEMTSAVRDAVAPAFYLEPMNDHSIDPTIELPRVAGDACRQYQSALYPAVDATGDGKIDKTDYDTVDIRDKAHGSFAKHVADWGPAAHEFMTRYFNHPAARFDKLCRGTSHATN